MNDSLIVGRLASVSPALTTEAIEKVRLEGG